MDPAGRGLLDTHPQVDRTPAIVLAQVAGAWYYWIGLDWIRLDWIGLDWIGLDWIGLDWIGLDWIGLDSTGLHWI